MVHRLNQATIICSRLPESQQSESNRRPLAYHASAATNRSYAGLVARMTGAGFEAGGLWHVGPTLYAAELSGQLQDGDGETRTHDLWLRRPALSAPSELHHLNSYFWTSTSVVGVGIEPTSIALQAIANPSQLSDQLLLSLAWRRRWQFAHRTSHLAISSINLSTDTASCTRTATLASLFLAT